MRKAFFLVILAFPIAAYGGLSSMNSYMIPSPDGKRVLVMISEYVQNDYAPPTVLPDGRVVDLRQTFGKSGAYDATTLDPLWQFHWYGHFLRASDDFRYVVTAEPDGFRSGLALAFYDNGRLIRKYNCSQLLTYMGGARCLPYRSGTVWFHGFKLNADHTRVLLSTARRQAFIAGREVDLGYQEFYSFDLATGSMLERRTSGAWVVWGYGGVALALPALLLFAARALWRAFGKCNSRRCRGFMVIAKAVG